jgi:hypothetical protein
VTGDLPIDEARVSGLVEAFIDSVDALTRSHEAVGDPGLVTLQSQLFAAVTQGFVDFGNLVSSAVPEIVDSAIIAQGDTPASAASEAVEALADAVAGEADSHADTAGALADALAEKIDAHPAPPPQLARVLTAARAIEDYWRDVSDQVQALPDLLDDPDPGEVARLRALAPIWHRVANRVDQAQQTLELPPAPDRPAPLRLVEDQGDGSDA